MNRLSILILLFLFMACKSQQVPLNTDYDNISNNSQLKDLDNIYPKFMGVWMANIGDKQVKLVIDKVENIQMNVGLKSYYSDALLVRYEIKINGVVSESSLNLPNSDVTIISDSLENLNSVLFFYEGGICKVGWGSIVIDYIGSTKLRWNYIPESSVLTNQNCPNYSANGIDILLPYEPENIIFTKQ